ncbi:FadR/GntR family transcriptional regulator [Alteribacillus sp. HJP-4]|uniref:FadR/GntR family transcriptional regulator n=1 Tax=Alteribacillus sp. HJP-4 TaxID=2775394 RepID=UPI0035CD0CBC
MILLEIQKISTKKISESVAEQMEGLIQSGRYEAHEKLPSVRELCDDFQVGRSAVRDAITTLKGKGLVYVKQGEGTFVSPFDSSKLFSGGVGFPDLEDIKELFQVRKILEAGIVEMAAVYRSELELAKMREAVERMKISTDQKSWQSDYDFHMYIAAAAGNSILTQLMTFISATTKNKMIDFHQYISTDSSLTKRIISQHEAIFQRIERKQPKEAREEILAHLSLVETLMQQSVLQDRESF